MAPYSDTARRCVDLATAAAPAMVGRAIDQAVAALQQEEQRSQSVPQRQELADAWLELTRRRSDWSERYPALLRAAQAAHHLERPAAPQPADEDFAALALVDEDALAREIESSRVLQLLAPRLEQPLAELDALMSTALGLAVVQPERNPLRPQVFAQSLRELMQPARQPNWPKLWTRHLAGPLAGEIATLYRDALKILHDAHLAAATYRVLPAAPAAAAAEKPAPPRPAPDRPSAGPSGTPAAAPGSGTQGNSFGGGAGGSGTGGGTGGGTGEGSGGGPGGSQGSASPLGTTGPLGGAAWADLSGYHLGDELFQNFLFSRTPPSAQALAPAYYAKVDAQLATMEAAAASDEPYDTHAVGQHRALPPVERPPRPVATTRALDDAVWGRWAPARERSRHRSRLKKEARQVGQVLGLEVVRKLVDQVARDERLLAPVREAIVALEPALLRLSLVNPRFFAQEEHAGRRLVERVAERSFRYNDEFASDFQEFFADVRTTFRTLNERPVEDDAPFGQALQELEERWTGEDALDHRGRQVAVDAMHFAQARAAEAAQVARTLGQRSDFEDVPAVVQDFLYGPWSLVIAHARLTDSQRQVDPGGWTAVSADLLWSVKSRQTLRDPARLFTMLPGMLERLRKGLKLVGQEPATHETFFQALEKLHRPVLKLRARQRHASHGLDGGPQVDAALLSTARRQPHASADAPWLTPEELQVAGFVEDGASAPAPLASAATDADAAAVIAGLHQGSWVDLHARERWRRASLTWVNGSATLFMFVSNGGQPHTMTRRSLERLVRERHLRPVAAGAVVPRAIAALSREDAAEPAVPPRNAARVAGEEQVAA